MNNMNDYLMHYGILGMKWGIRRYQNADGSLTSAGQKRYNKRQNRIASLQNDIKDYTKYIEDKRYLRPSGLLFDKGDNEKTRRRMTKLFYYDIPGGTKHNRQFRDDPEFRKNMAKMSIERAQSIIDDYNNTPLNKMSYGEYKNTVERGIRAAEFVLAIHHPVTSLASSFKGVEISPFPGVLGYAPLALSPERVPDKILRKKHNIK